MKQIAVQQQITWKNAFVGLLVFPAVAYALAKAYLLEDDVVLTPQKVASDKRCKSVNPYQNQR